jgi:hypothetical protein
VAPAFLAPGRYTATVVRDVEADAAAMTVETIPLSPSTALTFRVRPGGGFVVRVRPGV